MLPLLAQGVGSDTDDRRVQIAFAHALGEGIAVHERHVDVGEDQVVGLLVKQVQAFDAIAGHIHQAADGFQLFLHQQLVHRAVLGQQHAQAQRLSARSTGRGVGLAHLPRQRHVQGLEDGRQAVLIDQDVLAYDLRLKIEIVLGKDLGSGPIQAGQGFRHHLQHDIGHVAQSLGLGRHPRPVLLQPGAEAGAQIGERGTQVYALALQAQVHRGGPLGLRQFKVEGEAECAALALFAAETQVPPQHLAEAGADRQAQSGTAYVRLPVVPLVETFEQARLHLLGYARPAIGHLPLQASPARCALHLVQAHRHPPVSGELDGVADQVTDDLPDAQAVPQDLHRQRLVDAGVQRQALARGHGRKAPQVSSSSSRGLNLTDSGTICPASILDTSSTSLISCSSTVDELSMVRR